MGGGVAPLIVKLGGSVVTCKERPLTPDPPAIDRLAREVAEADSGPLIIVHGGGSYGHHVASEYTIMEGYREPRQLMGFSKTRQAMAALNGLVVDALIRHNLPAVSVQPSANLITRRGRISDLRLEPIKGLLGLGLVPVAYGDAVLDSELGFTILSGDQLTSRLATALEAPMVVIGVDVDGLYTEDPKTSPGARLIERITLTDLRRCMRGVGGAMTTDVTGGMFGKIRELVPAVEGGVEVRIVNAKRPGVLYKALKGEEVKGTTIVGG